jgi:hypothetical protein
MDTQAIKTKLTTKEFETFRILVRLGDSIELAYNTVIAERLKINNFNSYFQAYCS